MKSKFIKKNMMKLSYSFKVKCLTQNEKLKSSMVDYFIKSGEGQYGFCELIKIYGFLDNKESCIEVFDIIVEA